MEEVIIKNEFDHSYILLKKELEEKDGFPFHMITQNSIPGFLSCKLRYIEEISYYEYDITSKKSLGKKYLDQRMQFHNLQELFYGINRIMKSANEFLLPQEGFVLEPQYIYQDLETEELYCLYLPSLLQQERKQIKGRYRELADFLLDKTDHKDEHAVNVVYQFYKMSKEEFFSFEVFVGFIEKEALLLQAEERRREEKKKKEISDMEPSLPSEEEYLRINESDKTEKREWNLRIPIVLFVVGFLLLGAYLLIPALRMFALYLLLPGASIIGFAALMMIYILYQKFGRQEDVDWQNPPEPVRVEEYFDDILDGETVFFDEEMSVYLKWKEGRFSKEYRLAEFPVTVGKMRESVQMYIDDPSVSRLHARFKELPNGIILQDLDSTNGTYVNGKRLAAGEEAIIKRNDEIQFGKIIVNVV